MNSILDIRKITDLEIRKADNSCITRETQNLLVYWHISFHKFKSNKHINSIDVICDVNINLSDA